MVGTISGQVLPDVFERVDRRRRQTAQTQYGIPEFLVSFVHKDFTFFDDSLNGLLGFVLQNGIEIQLHNCQVLGDAVVQLLGEHVSFLGDGQLDL